jgi:RluA family pseudouridine synthase
MPSTLSILYQDSHLLAVNKPAGILSLPHGYDPKVEYVTGLLEAEYGPLWIVHRLDQETSGVLLLARTADAHRELNRQFEGREVEKVYHAIVPGNPKWVEERLSAPLLVDGDRKHRTTIDARLGKPAVTRFKVLERYGAYALIEARPETGRTHQIRVHLQKLGYPITGDPLYGNGEEVLLSRVKPGYHGDRDEERSMIQRLALHARTISFLHPETGERLQIEAPYPKDFESALKQMRKFQKG